MPWNLHPPLERCRGLVVDAAEAHVGVAAADVRLDRAHRSWLAAHPDPPLHLGRAAHRDRLERDQRLAARQPLAGSRPERPADLSDHRHHPSERRLILQRQMQLIQGVDALAARPQPARDHRP